MFAPLVEGARFYEGDNQYRMSGQALEFKQLNVHAWEAFDEGRDIHMQAAPFQAKLLFKNFKAIKEKLKSKTKDPRVAPLTQFSAADLPHQQLTLPPQLVR